MKIKFGLNLFAKESLLYALTMALGLVVSYRYGHILLGSSQLVATEYGTKDIFAIALIIIILVAIQRSQVASRWFYRIFLIIFIFGGAQTVGDVFFAFPISFYFALIVVALFIFWRTVLMHNFGLVLAIAGLASIIGLGLSPKIAIVALLVLSFYDIIAVYKTRHMVAMARSMILSGAPFGFVVPIQWAGFFNNKDEAQSKIGDKFMLLGAGDVGLPILLMSSIVLSSIWSGIIVGLFALIGVFVTHLLFINQDKREPMAALPPIATFAIIGYLITILLNI